MKGNQTCLLHAYLFESHLQQKDINQILHVRPLVNVGYNKDSGVILEKTQQRSCMSRVRSDIFYPQGEKRGWNLTLYDF